MLSASSGCVLLIVLWVHPLVGAPALCALPAAATALERLRQADADFKKAQRRRKAAMEELLRAQEAELAKTRERFFAKYGL